MGRPSLLVAMLALLAAGPARAEDAASPPGDDGWAAVVSAGWSHYADDFEGFDYTAAGPEVSAVLARRFGSDWYAHASLALALTDNDDTGVSFEGATQAVAAELLVGRRFGPVWLGASAGVSRTMTDYAFFDIDETIEGYSLGLSAAAFVADPVRVGAEATYGRASTSIDAPFEGGSTDWWTVGGRVQVFATDDLAVTGGVDARFQDGGTTTGVSGEIEYKLPDSPLGVYAGASYRWVDGEEGGDDYTAQTYFGGLRYIFGGGDSLKDVRRDDVPFF